MDADAPTTREPRSVSWARAFLFLLATVVVTTAASVWIIRTYVFPRAFEPVELTTKEERTLDEKIERLEGYSTARAGLEPEAYSESDSDREVFFTEREFNALLARNPDLARRVAIDFSDDLVSARVLVPLDEDFPLLGGQTVRLKAGVQLAYADGRPVVIVKGVSVMGVPLPSAWLGGLKNVDLVEEFGGEAGVWKAFADGVEALEVSEGRLVVRLKK